MNSWKTTIAGVLTIVTAIGSAAVVYLKTGSIPPLEPLIAQIMIGVGLIAARDNNVTSKQAGAE